MESCERVFRGVSALKRSLQSEFVSAFGDERTVRMYTHMYGAMPYFPFVNALFAPDYYHVSTHTHTHVPSHKHTHTNTHGTHTHIHTVTYTHTHTSQSHACVCACVCVHVY